MAKRCVQDIYFIKDYKQWLKDVFKIYVLQRIYKQWLKDLFKIYIL